MTDPFTRLTAAGIGALALLAAASCSVPVPTFDRPPALLASPPANLDAAAILARIPDTTGIAVDYDRDQFGGWADPDGNGCDARADTLERDADSPPALDADACAVRVEILDPYTGQTVTGGPAVQIDHVVPLADAWRSGADTWPRSRRVALANDPLNLLATSAQQNRAKSDSTADEWLPPAPAARCGYGARQVAVKAKYRLTVTPPERQALERLFTTCPGQLVPVDEGIPR